MHVSKPAHRPIRHYIWEGTNVSDANGDLLAVSLIGDAVDLLEVVRVGDDLVTGEGVLRALLVHVIECRMKVEG